MTTRAIPYWFSSTARRRDENLLPEDYVTVRGLPDRKFELMQVFPRFGSVRVREVGHTESMSVPWDAVTPWKKKIISSQTVMRAVGDWLFKGSLVYLLSEPGIPLRVKKIHWDRETSDLQDKQGRIYYDLSWDDLEFWDPEDYHLADDE